MLGGRNTVGGGIQVTDDRRGAFILVETSCTGKVRRNITEVDSVLNRINPSTNIISCSMQIRDTEPNSKNYLEKYFNIT